MTIGAVEPVKDGFRLMVELTGTLSIGPRRTGAASGRLARDERRPRRALS